MPKKRKSNRTEQFYNRMEQLIGETEARRLMESIQQIAPRSIRYNRNLCSPHELKGPPVSWCRPYGRYWQEGDLPSRTLEYAAGKYYIQEAGAMLPISAASKVIDFSDKIVLDLTAAPGGKATQIAELIRSGYLVANEVVKKRVAALTWNVNRHRLNNTIITSLTPRVLAGALPGFFDVVVVDAPCSGEGLFKRQKHFLENWSEKNVRFCARRQESILEDAAALVRPGGVIVYATCTFSPEENEDRVERLLSMNFTPVPFPEDVHVSPAISGNEKVCLCSRRIFPHREGGAGAFVGVVRKEETARPCTPGIQNKYRYGQSLPGGFRKDQFPYIRFEDPGGYFYEKKGIISYFSHENIPDFLMETGFQIGAPIIDKHRPHEPMFGGIQLPSPETVIEVGEEEAKKYIRGEDLDVSHPDGYYIVSCRQMPLGHVIVAGNRAANKLPGALRVRNA